MIVKKMPILQGFPDLETVKKLTKNHGFSERFVPLFYDIETTGLSRNSTFLYLIGAVAYEENNWQMYQWMIENEEEEPELLKTFSNSFRIFHVRSSITVTALTSLIWMRDIRSTDCLPLLQSCLLWTFTGN